MGRGQLIDAVRDAASYLGGSRADYDLLAEMAQGARFVLLGEATHGSHELYRERARITQRLVTELGFNAVVVEADWPDADRANRWAQGRSDDGDAADSLAGFRRFPTWMWRNTVAVDFVGWLRAHNEQSRFAPVLFHGMDLYSLYGSIDAVLHYFDRHDPEAAARARRRYGCFETRDGDPQSSYGHATRLGLSRSCEDEVLEQLLEIQGRAANSLDPELFSAEQNARLVANAERYYRAMFRGRVSSWNLRDTHMAETLDAVIARLELEGDRARVCVWAHNSHLGDARATAMGRSGELNVGQLVRERYGRDACALGFTTYAGTVTAAHDWDEPPSRRDVRPGLPGSVESLFHQLELPNFLLDLRDPIPRSALAGERLERAIGVIYRPETERTSHYFEANLPRQFDLVVHLDHTQALKPLERSRGWEAGESEIPETYPSAL